MDNQSQHTVYPKKYAHGFVVLCFVVVMQSFIMNSHEVFIHIHQGCFVGTGAIVRLPQWQWSKPDGYGKISQCITTTKHSKAKTVCIFLRIYCMAVDDLDICIIWQQPIRAMSHGHHGLLIHWLLKCLFKSSFRQITNITTNLRNTSNLWGESTRKQWIPPDKRPVIQKRFPYHYVVMLQWSVVECQ